MLNTYYTPLAYPVFPTVLFDFDEELILTGDIASDGLINAIVGVYYLALHALQPPCIDE